MIFRDEDLRAHSTARNFTQNRLWNGLLVEQEDILTVVWKLNQTPIKRIKGVSSWLPFENETYDDAMLTYGLNESQYSFLEWRFWRTK